MKEQLILKEAKNVLMQLVESINSLSFDEYTQKISLLSNSTIGEHTRHIIELFQQLLVGYENNIIDYDKRERNILIQQNIDFAIECTANIISRIDKYNKGLMLKRLYNSTENLIETNYSRELMYNIEHCIHHQAIIKIALLNFGKTEIAENLGVAKSTIEYKKQCAQ